MPNANKIKRRMAEMGMSQADLAAKIDVAVPTICQKINNIRPFSLEEAEIIAAVLKIKDNEFGDYFFSR